MASNGMNPCTYVKHRRIKSVMDDLITTSIHLQTWEKSKGPLAFSPEALYPTSRETSCYAKNEIIRGLGRRTKPFWGRTCKQVECWEKVGVSRLSCSHSVAHFLVSFGISLALCFSSFSFSTTTSLWISPVGYNAGLGVENWALDVGHPLTTCRLGQTLFPWKMN